MTANENTIRPGQHNNGSGQALERVGFGTKEAMVEQRETQGSAMAARATAEVQARHIMAIQRPRNLELVRTRMLEHCKRPGFAMVSEYSKPVGGKAIVGPSIRFVETALSEFGNAVVDSTVTFDDDTKRITRISVINLESNFTWYDDAIAEKFVERRFVKEGDEVLGSRKNTYGDTVFKVRATEDDFANKAAAAISKKARNGGLRILPADLVDEWIHACRETRKHADAQDPAAAKRRVIDAFVELGITPVDLEMFLGHPIAQVSPAELDELRGAHAAVKDGEAKWLDIIEVQRVRRGEVDKESKGAAAAGEALKKKTEAVRQKVANKAKPAGASDQKPPDSKPPEKQAEPKTNVTPAASAPKVAVDGSDPALTEPEWIGGKPAPANDAPPPLSTPKEGYEDRACAKCKVPIEVPKTDPVGAVCYSCSQS
jgi:translation initiation factor IF-1